ncbi:MAG TPA: VIT family protein [Terricaulis sp.]|nr:VIT family protein [Terricaulis sp.]HRP10331.1 VIT family protein [Terricaulis sp.]
MPRFHNESHVVTRIGWLRAAVLGANDGIVSTASLVIGVAAADAGRDAILTAGVAALAAGAMSMAAGEYVSVSSQADAEKADLAREKRELREDPAFEIEELTGIYIDRGLEPELARRVAESLSAKDALAAHARDELGISDATAARPIQAAFASALSFAIGAIMPVLAAIFAPEGAVIAVVAISSLIYLAALGALGARAGRARMARPVLRVTFWGALAMAVTAGVGLLFGVAA